MLKFLFLCVSFFSVFNSSSEERFLINEEVVEEKVIFKVDNYSLKIIEEEIVLFDTHEKLYNYPADGNVKVVKNGNNLIICSWENRKINIMVLDQFNRLIHKDELPGRFVKEFDIIIDNGNLIFVGGITSYDGTFSEYKKNYFNKTDAVICKFDHEYKISKINIYGGFLDEYFTGIKTHDDKIYLKGVKETLSGGDFGNGGNNEYGYIFAELNSSLQLLNYITTKTRILEASFFEDVIYLQTKDYIHTLDYSLKPRHSVKLAAESTFGYHSPNKTGVVYNGTTLNFYNLENQQLIKEYKIIASKVYLVDEAFSFHADDKIINLTIYDLIDFEKEYIYNGEDKNKKINNLFTEKELLKTTSTPAFDPLVYGDYEVDFHYEDCVISGKVTVPLEANITDGLIYPPGYNVLFTGIAYLNGQVIVNNHRIKETGNHQLVLVGCNGEEKVIDFTVDKDQIDFDEYLDKTWDYEIYPEQELKILLNINSEYEINEILLNNNRFENFEVIEEGLEITISERNPGIYHYQLQGIKYLVDEEEVVKNLDYQFKVNVLKNSLSVEGQFTNDRKHIKYKANVYDNESVVRGINVKLISIGDEKYYQFPICDRNIILSGLDIDKTYKCYFSLTIDEGNGVLKDFTLFDIELKPNTETTKIGDVHINKKGERLEAFEINIINDKSIPLIYNNNELIYEYQPRNILPFIFISIAISGAAFLAIYYFKK